MGSFGGVGLHAGSDGVLGTMPVMHAHSSIAKTVMDDRFTLH